MFSRKKTTISTDSCWDEGRKTATESLVEKVSGDTLEPAGREPRESEAARQNKAVRDSVAQNEESTAAQAEVACGETAEPTDQTSREPDASCKNMTIRDSVGRNDVPAAAPDTWLSGEAAIMAESLKRLIDRSRRRTFHVGRIHIFWSPVQEILRGFRAKVRFPRHVLRGILPLQVAGGVLGILEPLHLDQSLHGCAGAGVR